MKVVGQAEGESKVLFAIGKRYIGQLDPEGIREVANCLVAVTNEIRPLIEAYDARHQVASDTSSSGNQEEGSGPGNVDRAEPGGQVDASGVVGSEISGGPLAEHANPDSGHKTEVAGDSLSDGLD